VSVPPPARILSISSAPRRPVTLPPRLSIALPVRDAEPWLAECLDSILAQTETHFEVLAVDDSSLDGSRAILESYRERDSRIRILETTSEARGIVPALNRALFEARGEYIVRMDADDVMHPERLARQAEALDLDPSLFGVASRATAFPAENVRDGMKAYLDWQNALVTPEHIARNRFIECPVLHPSVTLRTELVREVLGGWRDCGWPEDWDFFMRAFDAGLRVGRVPEVLVQWRLHPEQATWNDDHYSQDALMEARATFLARRLEIVARADRSIWVLGAGPVGKTLIKSLAWHGVVAHGLADVDPRKIGGVVRGVGHKWRVVSHPTLRAMSPRPFAISAVAGAPARGRVRTELARWGWREDWDFIVAA
jgi:glycosyltransferase involved in cell wall biosynthesis